MSGLRHLPQFREMNPVPIGAAFLVVLLALIVLAFNLDRLPFTSGTDYSAAFSEAAGLRPGDKVMVGGVAVGNVNDVTLEGTHVRVDFSITDGQVHLGDETTASIEIATLLGNKYLSLQPAGGSTWPAERELPLEQTSAPYDVAPALQGLARTAGRIDTGRLARALDTLATTFSDSPPAIRSMLSGLSRLSRTVASRNTELAALLQRADTVTAVLADRRQQFVQIFGDGDRLLQMLEARRQIVAQLFRDTSDMAVQLTGLVHDNRASVGPMLAHLHDVLSLLNSQQGNLDDIVKGLYVFVRGEVDATGNGPWFDGSAINATNPYHYNVVPKTSRNPQTLGDLLGVTSAEPVLRSAR